MIDRNDRYSLKKSRQKFLGRSKRRFLAREVNRLNEQTQRKKTTRKGNQNGGEIKMSKNRRSNSMFLNRRTVSKEHLPTRWDGSKQARTRNVRRFHVPLLLFLMGTIATLLFLILHDYSAIFSCAPARFGTPLCTYVLYTVA